MIPSVFWPATLQAATLFASTGLSIWAVVISRTRRGDADTRILIAKVQYLGVAPIGVLWLLFTSHYSRASWPSDRVLRAAIWIVPAITLALAATNEQHHVYWRAITEVATPLGSRLVYTGGPRYWVHASYSYVLMAIGTLILVRGLRRFPPPYRRQTVLMIAGALVPWASNLRYLSRALPATGLDLTPIGFTVSGACFTWALYRYRLFGLVPVARDMVVDSMDDGVLVLDAQRVHGCQPGPAGGRSGVVVERGGSRGPAAQRGTAGDRQGRTRGGVAHDFNNLLTGILGNAELLAMQAPGGSSPSALTSMPWSARWWICSKPQWPATAR